MIGRFVLAWLLLLSPGLAGIGMSSPSKENGAVQPQCSGVISAYERMMDHFAQRYEDQQRRLTELEAERNHQELLIESLTFTLQANVRAAAAGTSIAASGTPSADQPERERALVEELIRCRVTMNERTARLAACESSTE